MGKAPIVSYLITDPAYYGSTPESVAEATARALRQHRPDMACFRDKSAKEYAPLAEAFVETAKRSGTCRVLLHGDHVLAHRLGADGVHLSSGESGRIGEAKALGLYVVISCHTPKELEKAQKEGADAATYSPVFATPGKGNPKGLEDLKEIVGKIDINIFALGGITTPEQIEQVAAAGAYGFASIRYFL